MEISEKMAQEALAEVNAKCAPFKCPMCEQKGNFLFGKAEFQHVGFSRKENQLIAEGNIDFIPIVAGSCPHCGFVATFNLRVLGLV